MKAQLSMELLVSFAIVISFVLLLALQAHQYGALTEMNSARITNSISALSRVVNGSPSLFNLSYK